MTDEEQEARSMKWEFSGSVTIRQLSTGRWAMYQIGEVGSPFWIGDFADLGQAYASRPAPAPRKPRPAAPPSVRASALAIDFQL